MPLWVIYHPTNTFIDLATKKAFAQAVTSIYNVKLPAFYVNIVFQPVEPTSFLIGAVARPSPHSEANDPGPDSTKPFIRITIQNIARTLPNDEARDSFLAKVDAAIKPFIGDMGYDWEYSVEETRRDLWKINGLVPPMPNTKAEKTWFEKNEPVPFEKADGGL